MYRKLLVGYDDSPASRAALLEAAHWVKKHGGELALVHAAFFDTEEFGIAPEHLEKRIALGRRLCTAAVKSVGAEPGVPARSIICEGEPPEVLLDTADGMDADLIVLGTYGRRGLRRMLMGSVTAQVISKARADVLVVHRPCQECRGVYRSLLVPYDGSAFSRAALGRACELAAADGAHVTVLYAIPRYEEMVGFLRTEGISARLAEEADKIVAEAARIGDARGVKVATSVAEGAASDRVVDAVKQSGFDLVVMGSHGHRGMERALLGSTAERVIVNAPCPVLVVKERP
jgi:nucleotide-binding universal stress UspA family protein